jgi:hypothetical protein
MMKENVRRLSRFALDARTTQSTDLATLVEFALTKDPGGYFDLTISLRADLRSQLAPDSLAEIRSIAEPSQSFRSPKAPRFRGQMPRTYDLNPKDPERLTNDYEQADHQVMVYESERSELRDRVKRWMRAEAVEEWEGFGFSRPRESWKVDLRGLHVMLPIEQPVQIGFPQRLRLAFEEAELEKLIAVGQAREKPVLRWLSRGLSVGPEAQQSRDWAEAVEPGEAGNEHSEHPTSQ